MKKISLIILIVIVVATFGCSHAVLRSAPVAGDLSNKIIYALPKGMIRVQTLREGGEKGQDVLKIEPVYVPDPNHFYVLERRPNVGYDDEVIIAIENNGLLKTIEVTTKSQVGAILMQVVDIAKEAFKITTPRGEGKEYLNILLSPDDLVDYDELLPIKARLASLDRDKKEKEDTIAKEKEKAKTAKKDKQKSIADTIKTCEDEIDKIKKDIEKINGEIPNMGNLSPKKFAKVSKFKDFGIEFIAKSWEKDKLKVMPLIAGVGAKEQDTKGIFYKPLLPCKVIIVYQGSRYEQMLYLPNESPVIAFDITRPWFTEKITKLSFSNGVLTDVHFKKQSELLAALKIPADILKAVSGMPLELLQLRVKYDQAANDLLAAQILQLQQQQKLLELQQKSK